jgi:hypothetical protein
MKKIMTFYEVNILFVIIGVLLDLFTRQLPLTGAEPTAGQPEQRRGGPVRRPPPPAPAHPPPAPPAAAAAGSTADQADLATARTGRLPHVATSHEQGRLLTRSPEAVVPSRG